MRIGAPKEIKEHEYRAGLTPESVREFALALAAGGLDAIAGNPAPRAKPARVPEATPDY